MSHDHGVKIDTIYLTQCGPTWSLDTDTFWTVLKLFLLYVVPLAFMTVTYYQITKVLWKSGNVSYTAGKLNQIFNQFICCEAGEGATKRARRACDKGRRVRSAGMNVSTEDKHDR